MYRAYNLAPATKPPWTDAQLLKDGTALFDEQQRAAKAALSIHLGPESRVSGTLMQQEWFPTIDAHIFLSHSHKNVDDVKMLAAWLKREFNIIAFIDSAAWGHAKDLLAAIDRHHCYDKTNNVYDYHARNGTTSHVHAMLTAALTTMIDRTECLFFINTPESLSAESAAHFGKGSGTHSPWIYLELSIASTVRQMAKEKHREMAKTASASDRRTIAERFNPAYDVTPHVARLTQLPPDLLSAWQAQHKLAEERSILSAGAHEALDLLYRLTDRRD
ncbi:hypothetical protein LBMAG47_25430 [Planctomycetia bacterium]|nr:hypothetical protein LBMAG47_25430 [Planctomycetia bacterium]